MILFQKDIDNLQPVIHHDTTNKSFIKMSIVLQRMGIKNNKFHLALYQEELRHIDPHSPHLTERQIEMILYECKVNCWYFYREVIKIPLTGGDKVPFILNRANLALIWCVYNYLDVGLIQPRQTGKAIPDTEPIKVPGGWKRMGDIKVGDIVTAHDGTASSVTGVYPQGKRCLLRVTFIDGRWVDVDEDHLWTTIHPPTSGRGLITSTMTTLEMMSRVNKDNGKDDHWRTFIPMNQSEQIPDADLPIHPYLLGILLGDGSITDISKMSICTYEEILDRLTPMLPDGVMIKKASHRYKNNVTVGYIFKVNRGREINKLGKLLEELGLAGCNSLTKFIPEIYLNASHNQRMELIRGLMDTGGYASKSGIRDDVRVNKSSDNEYSTSSERLAHDFQLLLRSIGAQCKLTSHIPSYTHNGERKYGSRNYRLHVRYPWMSDLFWIPRKKDFMIDSDRESDKWKLRVMSVQPLSNKEECTCIAIDHPDKLYITKDYIVTHNTMGTQSIVAHIMYILADSMHIGLFTKDSTLVQDNVGRLKSIRDALPWYVVERSTKDWDRKEGLSYALKDNFYKTFTAAIDERGAYKLGRGATMGLLHFDELPFINHNYIIVSTAINAMIAASEQAKKKNIPSAILYTTTAGDPDTKTGAYALSIFENAVPFTEHFYDLEDKKELDEHIRKHSTNRVVYLEFSYKQLGYTDEWFREKSSRSNSTQDDINRDFLNIWQSSTTKAVISKELLTKIRQSEREPSFTDLSDGFMVRWYIDRFIAESVEFKSRPLIMGMDTAENVGRDFTTFVIIDPRNMRIVATCRCNENNIIQVAKHVVTLLLRYSGIVFIPERNNTGIAIIDFVLEELQARNINPYHRIYNEVIQHYGEPKFSKVNIHNYKEIYGTDRSNFGFRTSGGTGHTSRTHLYKIVMMKALEMNHDKISDRILISEFGRLQERNGRIDHPEGCHDDTVIAYLLSCFLVYFGKHLDMYKIPSDIVLKELVTEGDRSISEARSEQLAIQGRIEQLEDLLSRNPVHVLKQSYLRELNDLRPLIDDTLMITQPLAVTQMKHQTDVIEENKLGSSVDRLRGFTYRFLGAQR